MKKILAIMLSVMMVLCMMPSMAFASGQTADTPATGETTEKTEITSIALTNPSAQYTYTGQEIKPEVTVKAGDTTVPAKKSDGTDNYTVSYSNNTAVGNASVSITVPENGAYIIKSEVAATITFTIGKKNINDVTLTAPNNFKIGTDISTLTFDLKNGSTPLTKGTDYTITSPTTATTVQEGPQNVTVTGVGNYDGTTTVRIYGGQNIETYTIDAIANVYYDGTPKTPSVVVRDANNNIISSSNYTVSYSNNINARGNAQVTVTGKGAYAGTIHKNFTILPRNISNVTVAAIDNQKIGGTPEPEVKDGNKKLTKGTDYTLSYQNQGAVGTATIYITGINNYDGQIYRNYYVKKELSARVVPYNTSYEYTGSPITPLVTITPYNSKDYYVLNRDYKFVNAPQTNVGNYTYSIVGMGDYGGTLYEGTYSIVARSLSSDPTAKATLSSDTVLYDGKKAEPAVTVTCNGRTLVKNVDYTVSYYNNEKIGTATLYVYGKGNYTGSITKTFRIVGKDLSSLSATLSQTTYNYTGLEHKPTVTIYDGTKKLVSGTDYTVAYKDNKNSGTATVTITGKGNYSGTKTLTFTIVGKDQSLTTNYTYYTKYLTSSAFNLNAQTDGDGVIVYESSDKSVATVSATGTVTVHDTGIAYITVKTTKDVKYNPASKTVKVTVKPKKPAFKLTTPAKKQVKVTITKVDGATKYQVRYGRMGSYKNRYIAHKDNGYDTTYVTLKNLKPGKNYFIKVRSYKTLSDGTKVWGNWTVIKKIKTK